MRYLFSALSELRHELALRRKFIMLDYDGTLTPIVDKPELAILHYDMQAVLKKLATKYPIAIISGRSLNEIKNLVKLKGIYYAGNHGFEISNDKRFIHPSATLTKPVIAEICFGLEKRLKAIKGVLVENKGLTASVHYRVVAKKDLNKLSSEFKKTVLPYLQERKIKITSGKKVLEIRPEIKWDKGMAVEWLIKVTKKQGFLPVYLGDNRTDEDAFLALRGKGLGILVSGYKKVSFASYYLKNVNEVKKLLTLLSRES